MKHLSSIFIQNAQQFIHSPCVEGDKWNPTEEKNNISIKRLKIHTKQILWKTIQNC